MTSIEQVPCASMLSMKLSSIFFVIPIYDEAPNLELVLEAIAERFAERDWHIIAVDDGSSDGSAEILQAWVNKQAGRLQIICHPENRGVPAALTSGFTLAAQQAGNDDVIICLEGDGTSDPLLLAEMADAIERGADLVVASRYTPGGKTIAFPLWRRLVSQWGNALLRWFVKYPGLTDYSIFYRAYRAGLVRRMLQKYGRYAFAENHFAANAGFLLRCLEQQPYVVELPNTYRYHLKRSASRFLLTAAMVGYCKLLRRTDWRRLRACRASIPHAAPRRLLAEHLTLCPECHKPLRLLFQAENDRVLAVAVCARHGRFIEPFWASVADFRFLERTRNRSGNTAYTAFEPSDRHLSTAKSVMIDVTQRCNLHCEFCFACANRSGDIKPVEQLASKMIASLSRAKFRPTLFLSGGEPTLHDDLPAMIRDLRQAGFLVKLLTNGIILTDPARLAALTNAGLEWLCLQYDGDDPQASLKMRNRDVSAEKKQVLSHLRTTSLKVMLTVAIDKNINLQTLGHILEIGWEHPRVMHIGFLPISALGWSDRTAAVTNTNPGDLLDAFATQLDGRLTKNDFFTFRRLASFLYRLCGNKNFFQRNCFFQVLMFRCHDGYFPVTRFLRLAFFVKHWRDVPRLIFNARRLLDWDGMALNPDFKLVTIEKFHDEQLIDLDQISDCVKVYLTPDGFLPVCAYNRRRHEGD